MNNDGKSEDIKFQRPENKDIAGIFQIISQYSAKGLLLPMTQDDIVDRLDSFFIASYKDKAIACVSVRNFGDDLFELRSLAVKEDFTGRGIGGKLVAEIINKTFADKQNDNIRLFALTYQVEFFKHLGFEVVEKSVFPQKIWSDCANCPKFSHCDEIAVQISSALYKNFI
jgi:amino-acid N-acetyltransferase